MTAAAGMVTRTAAQIILVESVALGCDFETTGDRKMRGQRERPQFKARAAAVSPLCGVGAKSIRERRTPVQSQQSERLQFPWQGVAQPANRGLISR
jgi:hypothetical protein